MTIEQQILKDVDILVPRPDIALEVMSLAHSQKSSITSLADKIEQDPSLTANILKIANSAFFGHTKEINSIKDVVVRIGTESVKLLAIGAASIGILQTPQKAYSLEPGALWKHSYATAILAAIIGKFAKSSNTAILYSAGLLHDIGKILLNKPLVEKYSEAIASMDGSQDIITIENHLLSTTHPKIGKLLLDKWGLPENITLPVGKHHDINILKEDNLNCKIVYMANFLANNIGISSTEPDECIFDRKSYDDEIDFSIIPGLKENIEEIITEFYNKFIEK